MSPNTSVREFPFYESFVESNDSTFNFSDHNGLHQDKTSSVVITFIYFMVCAVGLCGNTLVIYVILRYAKMKTVTNIYILNLAVADVLCMMSLPFIALQLALVHWPFGEVLCRVIMTVGRWKEAKPLDSHTFQAKAADLVEVYECVLGKTKLLGFLVEGFGHSIFPLSG